MKEWSAGKMLETWQWMENRQVCVWIDNCYIKQNGTHPTIQDQSQNWRALCVVEIPCKLPYFRGHLNIDVLMGSIGSVAAALVGMKRTFHGIVTDLGLLADRPAAIPSMRAPLDVVRDPLQNPGWKPLLLSTHQVSSDKGLVEVLDCIALLSNHKHPIVPILVDENIHKRCLKLLYSDRMQRWNWHEKLKRTPVLYGCWHPYKIPSDQCVAPLSFAVCVLPLWLLRSGKNIRVVPEAQSHGENYCRHPQRSAAFLAAVAKEIEQITGCCRSRWDGDRSTQE